MPATPTMPAADTADVTAVSDADAKLLNARVVGREDLTSELAILRILPDGGVPDFKPGQYATIGVAPAADADTGTRKGLGRFTLRPYSISSSPLDKEGIEFYLARVDGGALTPRLWELAVGDRLYCAPKCKGKFTLDGIPAERDLVAVATGTGLAPFVSMLRTYRETGRWRRFVVLHGTRLSADLGYRHELEKLAAKDDTVVYVPACSREPEATDGQGWLGLRGRIHVALDDATYSDLVGEGLTPEQCHVLLCGNPSMIDEVTNSLVARGFTPKDRENPDGNVHFEKYW